MEEKKGARLLDIFPRCSDPAKAKEIVLDNYPDAFIQTSSNGWTKRKEYTCQRLVKTRDDVDGDSREDLGATGFSEDEAWLIAADNILREKEKRCTQSLQ